MAPNAAWRLAATIGRVAIGLVAVSLYTRILGMTQWGLLALFQAAVAPLAVLDVLGRSTVKFVAESVARGDRRGAAAIVQTAFGLNLAIGVVGAAGLVAVAPWLARSVFAIPPDQVGRAIVGFRAMAAVWLLGVLTATYAAVLAAHQRYDLISKLASAAVLVSTCAGLAAAGLGHDVAVVVVAQAAVAAAFLAPYRWAAMRLLPESAGLAWPHQDALRRSASFWRWEVVGVAGTLVTGWADRYILGAYFGPALVGYYAVASVLQAQLYGAFLEMGEVLFPTVSRLEGEGDLRSARRLSLLVGWTLAMGFGICAVVLAVIGGDFLRLWVSPEAAAAVTHTLRLLCVASILSITAIAPLYYTVGLGRIRWDAAAGVLLGATVVTLGLLLIPRYGLEGVGWGLIGGALVRCVLVLFIWRAHFRGQVDLAAFAAHAWAPALVSIALLLGLSSLHDLVAPRVSWPGLVVEGASTLGLAAAVQLGISELFPGGRSRRRDVAGSFRPVIAGWLRGLPGGIGRGASDA
jgi:O-antigen/teichoic acid export membrane protein